MYWQCQDISSCTHHTASPALACFCIVLLLSTCFPCWVWLLIYPILPWICSPLTLACPLNTNFQRSISLYYQFPCPGVIGHSMCLSFFCSSLPILRELFFIFWGYQVHQKESISTLPSCSWLRRLCLRASYSSSWKYQSQTCRSFYLGVHSFYRGFKSNLRWWVAVGEDY